MEVQPQLVTDPETATFNLEAIGAEFLEMAGKDMLLGRVLETIRWRLLYKHNLNVSMNGEDPDGSV